MVRFQARSLWLVLLAMVLLLPVACKPARDAGQGGGGSESRSIRTLAGGDRGQLPATQEKGPAKEQIPWKLLREDGYHDPTNPGIEYLQEPRDVLSKLPRDPGGGVGNHVLWVQSLRDGLINPRTNIYPETNIRVIDLDVLLTNTGNYPYVLFPHRPHTEWLDCENCHEWLFASKKGETRKRGLSMLMILNGEFCGRCHGAVAFPLVLCTRCHSVPKSDRAKYED